MEINCANRGAFRGPFKIGSTGVSHAMHTCNAGLGDCFPGGQHPTGLNCSVSCPKFVERVVSPYWKVDVVITSHNYGRFLNDALDAVDRQSKPILGTVIVVDDASDPDDETKSICEARGVQYLRTEFKSPHLARGAGFDACSSPLVWFLDADNTAPDDYLVEAAKLFADNRRLAIVYSDLQQFDDAESLRRAPDRFSGSALEQMNFIDTGSVWRREAIRQVNGFAADPTGWEDWHLARAVMRSGPWEVAKNPIPLNYRKHVEQRIQNRPDKSYYSTAGLADETVTVFLTVSGRSHANADYFQRHKKWLTEQSWPKNQIRILIANTSHQPLPAEWIQGFDGFAGVSWYDHPVGRPNLEDAQRAGAPLTELEVQTVVASINNRMLREVQTEFVLSLENDVFPESLEAIDQLLQGFSPRVCAVSGAYRQRYWPQAWTAWRSMPPNGVPQLPAAAGRGIEPVYGTGFGCLMLRVSQVADEVITGQTETSGYYDADWFDRLQKRGRQVRVNWDVTCEHAGKQQETAPPQQPRSTFAPCANLLDQLPDEICQICGNRGKPVPIRRCSVFGKCAPTRYTQINQPHICDRQCVGFSPLVQLVGAN